MDEHYHLKSKLISDFFRVNNIDYDDESYYIEIAQYMAIPQLQKYRDTLVKEMRERNRFYTMKQYYNFSI